MQDRTSKMPNICLQVLDKFLIIHGDAEGPFLFGSNFSVAEVFTASLLRMGKVVLQHYRDYDVLAEAANFQRFKTWAEVSCGSACLCKSPRYQHSL